MSKIKEFEGTQRSIIIFSIFLVCVPENEDWSGKSMVCCRETHIQVKPKGNNRIQTKNKFSIQLFRFIFYYSEQYRTNVRVFQKQPVVLQIHARLPTGIHRLLFDDSLYTGNPYLLFSFLLFFIYFSDI